MLRKVLAGCANRIDRVSPQEISLQYGLLVKGTGLRAILSLLTYGFAVLIIPLPAALACAALDFSAEALSQRWMKDLVPARNRLRYLGTVGAMIASQMGFSAMLALCYHSDTPLAQPFAAGTLTLTMLQMASIRVIHLPYAVAGLSTAFCMAVGAVVWDWQSRSGPWGLMLSLLALSSAAYFIKAIVSANHGLHADIAHERATAQMADQAKSRFLAQMSHELRTPLNAILGLGHVELTQARDPASQERLRLVTDAARGLAVILDDILDMSAIEAGHLPIRPVLCSPADEIRAAAALFRPLFQAQSLEVSLRLSTDLPAGALMDKQRLRQCLSNLFSNALKHTTSGGVTLTATIDDSGRLAIGFTDTGPGIPPSEAERIFQPFQRGKGAKPGTGLGLSITRALARSMGGDLQLVPRNAAVFPGARFLLTLALQDATDTPPDPTGSALSLVNQTGQRVLVVDDIATNRLVAKAHLRLYGMTTEEAATGAEAVEKLAQDPVDLVLLDMNMPEMDGIATLAKIRALPGAGAQVPVIAMTADATEAHRRRYLAAGMDGYLAKPLTPEAVMGVLSEFLGQGDQTTG